MLEKVFSPEMMEQLSSPQTRGINCGDRNLVELYVAGVAALSKEPVVWIVKENENAARLKLRLEAWLRFLEVDDVEVCFYSKPFEDPFINNDTDFKAVTHKAGLVAAMHAGKRILAVTTLSSLSIQIEPPELFELFFIPVETGEKLDRDGFIEQLKGMGYLAKEMVEEQGEVAWRGSIVDVFPADGDHPLRFEFEARRVVSIRLFEVDSQASIKTVQSVEVPFTRFFLEFDDNLSYLRGDKEELFYLTDVLEGGRVVVSDVAGVHEEHAKLMETYEKILQTFVQKHPDFEGFSLDRLFDFQLDPGKILSLDEVYDDISGPMELMPVKKTVDSLDSDDMEHLRQKITEMGYHLAVLSNEGDLQFKLKPYLDDFEVFNLPIPVSIENTRTNAMFLGHRKFREEVRKPQKLRKIQKELAVGEMQPGDLVAHKTHGIGRFAGFARMRFGKFEPLGYNTIWRPDEEEESTEFLKIEYQNSEFLYVPVYELGDLNKYLAFEGSTPNLDRLGGKTWKLKKTRAKSSIVKFARELLDLYAKRKAIQGHSHMPEPDMEYRLQQEFQFVETEDQRIAIDDVFRDLEAPFPMDRLVCGDVSFGKTEVAIRAAFRIVMNGKQVAVLCPTTILAFQHFNTFKKRLASFPVRIAMLSRNVTGKERRELYENLENGQIDIVIGTHSLLAKGVAFKSLGLYIVDEEQRFGVFQKEKLKKDAEEVDVLSLTATPIPRTLSFSMAGLQDISIIRTAPLGRLAVKNYVGYLSKELVVSAVLNEIEREGQIYIVYNNIEKIYTFKERLQGWLPDVSFEVIHAQMRSESIEKTIMDFTKKKFHVLVSTTIIENGIDIPSVNTLVIMHADRFGLTQLYQLRGRIGRSNRQAYAYFMVDSFDITEKAKARLEAIREFSALGSGYKLAEFDLKLRGAGSLLGNRQHGHIEALGYDYYLELLQRTIKELQGEEEKGSDTKLNIHFSYSISSQYIRRETERIAFYRSVIDAKDLGELSEVRSHLEDRYGAMPLGMEKIFLVAAVRIIAAAEGFKEVDLHDDRIFITPGEGNAAIGKYMVELQGQRAESNCFEFELDDYRDFTQRISGIFTAG
jgi:transcription-repair coupling factor